MLWMKKFFHSHDIVIALKTSHNMEYFLVKSFFINNMSNIKKKKSKI